ncbi:hypothetical protein HBNCFIEN_01659 [Legionella sp. PC997]|nr:hypothetical protein HBNCFIEN_01659 [Legionella sp. PC997]
MRVGKYYNDNLVVIYAYVISKKHCRVHVSPIMLETLVLL